MGIIATTTPPQLLIRLFEATFYVVLSGNIQKLLQVVGFVVFGTCGYEHALMGFLEDLFYVFIHVVGPLGFLHVLGSKMHILLVFKLYGMN